jgi:hypothetical protein
MPQGVAAEFQKMLRFGSAIYNFFRAPRAPLFLELAASPFACFERRTIALIAVTKRNKFQGLFRAGSRDRWGETLRECATLPATAGPLTIRLR